MTELRHLRILAGLRLYDVRHATGIAESKLSLIERALVGPSSDEATALAAAVGASPDRLFTESGDGLTLVPASLPSAA